MLSNKNLISKRNIELGNDQYIRITCEMDSQGNPIYVNASIGSSSAFNNFWII